MRVAARLLTALILVAVPLTPVAAEPPGSRLTVIAGANTYVTFTVPDDLAYDATYDFRGTTVDFGDGRWGGFAVGPDAPGQEWRQDWPTIWSVWDPPETYRFPLIGGLTYETVQGPDSREVGVLHPGRYRVYVFGEPGHSVTITMPWNLPTRTLYGDKPFHASLRVEQHVVRYRADVDVAMPLSSPRRSWTVGVAMWQSDDTAWAPGEYATNVATFAPVRGGGCFVRSAPPDPIDCDSVNTVDGWMGRGAPNAGAWQEFQHGPTRGEFWRGQAGNGVGLFTVAVLQYWP